ncbi:MAG: Do family serine endopeptidase [Pseudomonadota bacterium]
MVKRTNLSNRLRSLTAATAISSGLVAVAAAPALADEALADLVEQVAPSVVTVLSSRDVTPAAGNGDTSERFSFPEGTPFDELFRRFGQVNGIPEQFSNRQPAEGLGSGFILDAEGWIVTNHHVVNGADTVTVRLSDDREYEAEIVGMDAPTDLALLRIDAEEALPFVTLGDSSEIRVGEDVMAVGNPFGLGGTVTKGIISAKGRNISAGPYADFLQTDAAINRGNSGGPLFNMDGEVVGVNSAIYSPTGGSVGVGFAVTSDIVNLIVEDLKDDGQVQRGWLGVSIQDVTPDLAEALGLEDAAGALVSSVVPGSPSEGRLETGDVILSFNGDAVPGSRDLPKLVAAAGAGDAVDVIVLRDGDRETIEINVGKFEPQQTAELATQEPAEGSAMEQLGATVAELTDSARAEIGVDEDINGLVITSLSDSGAAAEAGLQVGDVIVRLGSQPTETPKALSEALETEKTDPALMLVNRSGQQIFLAVKIA